MKNPRPKGPLQYNRRGHRIGDPQPWRDADVNRAVLSILVFCAAVALIFWLLN